MKHERCLFLEFLVSVEVERNGKKKEVEVVINKTSCI